MSGLCCEKGFFSLGLLFLFLLLCVCALSSTKGVTITGGGIVAGAISTAAVPVEGKRKELWLAGISQPF